MESKKQMDLQPEIMEITTEFPIWKGITECDIVNSLEDDLIIQQKGGKRIMKKVKKIAMKRRKNKEKKLEEVPTNEIKGLSIKEPINFIEVLLNL